MRITNDSEAFTIGQRGLHIIYEIEIYITCVPERPRGIGGHIFMRCHDSLVLFTYFLCLGDIPADVKK